MKYKKPSTIYVGLVLLLIGISTIDKYQRDEPGLEIVAVPGAEIAPADPQLITSISITQNNPNHEITIDHVGLEPINP